MLPDAYKAKNSLTGVMIDIAEAHVCKSCRCAVSTWVIAGQRSETDQLVVNVHCCLDVAAHFAIHLHGLSAVAG